MPVQKSWVEHWLDRYCQPGSHTFVAWGPDSRVCARCGKVELVDDRTCMICGIPGEIQSRLRSTRNPGLDRVGKLCGVCLDEFASRSSIRDWVAESA